MRSVQHLSAATSGTFRLGGDLPVHRLGFGAMRITGRGVWGPPADRAGAIATLRHLVDLDVNLIDTAPSYGPHISEELIAEALYPYPRGLVIATKAGQDRPGPDQWIPNGRPGNLRKDLEGSLRRLRVDCIDLYQLHRVDSTVPEADQFGAFQSFQQEGKIRHVGLSEVTVDQIERARSFFVVASVQNRYNLVDRGWEPVLDYCDSRGIAFMPWYPLLVGEVGRDDPGVQQIAAGHRATPAQIALAWLLRRSPVMLPIPGTSRIAHLEENVAAAGIALTDTELLALSKRRSTAGETWLDAPRAVVARCLRALGVRR